MPGVRTASELAEAEREVGGERGSGEWGVRGQAAVEAAVTALAGGQIVAVKGLGGFHLACDATDDAAVARLRERKGRVDKPFAVMAADLETVAQIAQLDDASRRLLTSPERPIVLLPKRADSPLSDARRARQQQHRRNAALYAIT